MLKFKYLFDNHDLATMLASNWGVSMDKPDAVTFFRSSANAIYTLSKGDELQFLRFAPVEEKQSQMIQAELDYLRYLRENGYPAPKTVLSRNGKEAEVCETPWGLYTAVVFKAASGQRLDRLEYSDSQYYGYGEMLGKLHLLSKCYTPAIKRPDWRDKLLWALDVLREYAAPDIALREVFILEQFFAKLPVTGDNYGLVHYDFEPDNVFYDKATTQFSVIDFDDMIYHWYALDLDQAVNSVKDELPEHLHEQAAAQFLCGYRAAASIDDSLLQLSPIFRRYVNLFGYARGLRSMHEKWDNEPDWMTGLRGHLRSSMDASSEHFGEDICTR